MHKNKPCPGAAMYYRQIDGEGEALPHCSICHKPVKVKEKVKSKEEEIVDK